MNLKSFLKILKKNYCSVNKTTIEYFKFVFAEPYLKCSIILIDKVRIRWTVKFLGGNQKIHPQGKWITKRGDNLKGLIIYLEYKGVKLIKED